MSNPNDEAAEHLAQAEAERLLYAMGPDLRLMFLNRLIMADPFRALKVARKVMEMSKT